MIPVEVNTERFVEMVRKTHAQAITEGIRANAIIINENMVKIPETWAGDGRYAISLPEMICGLNIIWTMDELPDNYSFALVTNYGANARLARFESIGMEPEELRKAAEIYRKIKEVEE